MFTETANVDYHLSIADRGKQKCIFPFPFAANKRKFVVSVRSKQTQVAIFRLWNSGNMETYVEMRHEYMETLIHGHGELET